MDNRFNHQVVQQLFVCSSQIRAARAAKNISRGDFATLAGLPVALVNYWEKDGMLDDMPWETKQKFLSALSILNIDPIVFAGKPGIQWKNVEINKKRKAG